MFGLDPLSLPVALTEMLLLLSLAALVGWLLAHLLLIGRIRALRTELATQQDELASCRRLRSSKSGGPVQTVQPTPTPIDMPAAEPMAPPIVPIMAAPVLEVPIEVTPVAPPNPVPTVDVTPVMPPLTADNSEDAVLHRIAARAGEINFDRIGRASAAEADDLKDIVGIGPFLERKLHSLGIYTFRQIANFTKDDIRKVNEIIEFFPGRIERDNWVGQSKLGHERKYGTNGVA